MSCKKCVQYNVTDKPIEQLLMGTVNGADLNCKDHPELVTEVYCPEKDDVCTSLNVNLVYNQPGTSHCRAKPEGVYFAYL